MTVVELRQVPAAGEEVRAVRIGPWASLAGLATAAIGAGLVGALSSGVGLGATPRPSRSAQGSPAASRRDPSAPPLGTVSTLDGAVVAGRFVRPVTVGTLTVAPAPAGGPSAPLGLDGATARALASVTEGLERSSIVGFGLVSISGVSAVSGTPTFAGTPAWIAIGRPGTVFSCPAITVAPTTSPSPGDGHGVYPVAVFYGAVASGGPGAVLYESTGTLPCDGGTASPTLSAADADVPVPWSVSGPVGVTTPVTYEAPACARLEGVATAGTVHSGVYSASVTVEVPFDRTGCHSVQRFDATISVYPQTVAPGAPPPPSRVVLEPAQVPALPAELTAALP